jgi:hypothetical protein
MLPLNPAQCTLGNEGLDEYQCAAANPAGASRLQSLRPVRRVAELGSLEHIVNEPRYRVLKRSSWGALLLGLLLCGMGFFRGVLDPFIFDSSGNFRRDGIFRDVSPVLLEAKGMLSYSVLWALPCLLLGIWGLIFYYAHTSERFPGLGRVAVALGVLVHLLVLVVSLPFFFVPAGDHIRPMAWAALLGLVSVGSFVLIEPISIIAVVKEEPPSPGVFGLILGVTPFFLGWLILFFASLVKGFSLSP